MAVFSDVVVLPMMRRFDFRFFYIFLKRMISSKSCEFNPNKFPTETCPDR